MTRLIPPLLGLALLLLDAGHVAADARDGIANTLALQQAMERAKHSLLQPEGARAAVETLEKELPRVNGNTAYLQLLRDAYRAYIRDLCLANRADMAKRYLERLSILDPSAANDPTLRPQPLALKKPLPPPAAPKEEKPAPVYPDFARSQAARAAQAAAGLEKPQPTAVRAKNDAHDDPFDASNRRSQAVALNANSTTTAREMLARAEKAFTLRNYVEAKRYYDKAHDADRTVVVESRQRWAYCMLSEVVARLNEPGLGGRKLSDLQRQVQSAVALAPQTLGEQGRELLRQIENRASTAAAPNSAPRAGRPPRVDGAATTVRHRGRNKEGWQVAETEHFLIFHHRDEAFAERIARIAEQTRTAMYRKWFGVEGAAWQPKCELILHPDAASYSQMTGVPTSSPGHSRIESDPSGRRIVGRRMDIRLDTPDALEAVLPHEATHVVLAGQFGQYAVPRWADEGIAVLTEPEEKVRQHRRNLQRQHQDGLTFTARQLMEMEDYPAPRRVPAFYAQSVMLVEFLTSQKGPTVFTAFVRDGLRQGYETALRQHYGWDFPTLEQRFAQQVLGESRVAAGSGPR